MLSLDNKTCVNDCVFFAGSKSESETRNGLIFIENHFNTVIQDVEHSLHDFLSITFRYAIGFFKYRRGYRVAIQTKEKLPDDISRFAYHTSLPPEDNL